MRATGVKQACIASPKLAPVASLIPRQRSLLLLPTQPKLLPMWALWSCGRRASVVQAQRQIHSVLCWPPTPPLAGQRVLPSGLPRYMSSSDVPFDARRTSHPVAVLRAAGTTIPHHRGHRARKGGSTLYCAMLQQLFATFHPPGSNGLIRPRRTRDNDCAFPKASDWLHDSTSRDLAVGDISRQGNEQLAGERYDRDAADPAALGANALVEPTAESTVGLVSHPHPGKLDHCGSQTWISCFRDALFVVDAATLPWTGSQACISRQLPSVLEVAEQPSR